MIRMMLNTMRRKRMALWLAALVVMITGCERNPDLHLWDWETPELEIPMVELELDVYWDYQTQLGINYDWRAEWYYGWDEEDQRIFGELGYTEPTKFNLRRYYTVETPYAPHDRVLAAQIDGRIFRAPFEWGYWDNLAWNDVHTLDGVQSLIFDEQTSLDYVTAYTNPSMNMSRYHAPRYNNSFYEPEPLFAAYEQAFEINRNLEGFVWDEERNMWVRKLHMTLEPITYIYLPQVIIHHNNGRISAVTGTSNLSGMARSTILNTGIAGNDAIAVYFNMRMKKDMLMESERVDIVGGRLMTFGICGHNVNRVSRGQELKDVNRHYLDVTMQFNNGMDSTFVFDVTDQVRKRYKGGVITVELDMDTIPTPNRTGGTGFNAVVKETEDGGTYEFDLTPDNGHRRLD